MCEPISLRAYREARGLDMPKPRPLPTEVIRDAGWYQDRIVRHGTAGWQGMVLGENRYGQLVVEVACGEYRSAWPAEVVKPEGTSCHAGRSNTDGFSTPVDDPHVKF